MFIWWTCEGTWPAAIITEKGYSKYLTRNLLPHIMPKIHKMYEQYKFDENFSEGNACTGNHSKGKRTKYHEIGLRLRKDLTDALPESEHVENVQS